jgi:hypothetical protein
VTARKGFLGALSRLFGSAQDAVASSTPVPPSSGGGERVGRDGASATVEIAPPGTDALRITYTPLHDGDPDAGEIVWTWVPYAENDGRGKDRPVLVIGRQNTERVFAVRLTSKSHDGDRDFLSIGAGPWDTQGRPSWVDIEQLYSVHTDGMRREASALDHERFARVADSLHRRYGWAVGN